MIAQHLINTPPRRIGEGLFVEKRYPLHEAICIAAIRERNRQRALNEVRASWLGRDDRGRFARKVIGQ